MVKLIATALPIDLDYQVQLRTMEIHDVSVNGPLSQERVAQHFALFQLAPQQTEQACCASSVHAKAVSILDRSEAYRDPVLNASVSPKGHPPLSKGESHMAHPCALCA